MSIQQFTNTLQSKVYKDWLAKLDNNIITSTVDSMRASEQVASKTDFYITSKTVKDIFKTITGNTVEDYEAKVFLDQLVAGSDKTSEIRINGARAVKFTNIGFDTISTKLKQLLDSHDDIQMAYMDARDEFERVEKAALAQRKDITSAERKKQFNDIERRAGLIGFGTYFNKGHVVSIATNATKRFRDALNTATTLSEQQRKLLVSVVDKYISKLQADDLSSANLPASISQELYASYTKSSDKYLVELQCSVKNQESGRSSIGPIEELRKIFGAESIDIEGILKKSPALGQALAETQGSPSYIDLLVDRIVSAIKKVPSNNKTYTIPKVLIGKKVSNIVKPKKNTTKIATAKSVLNKLKTPSTGKNAFVESAKISSTDLTSLQRLLDAQLQDVVSANMGSGNERQILNYRTGRLAASAKVERLTMSKAGMITAFYTYMKNPYGTFSEGGRQQYPRSRDPKLLISKSIKEIAANSVANRLRAVAL